MHQSDFIQIVTIGLFRKFLKGIDQALIAKVEQALNLSLGHSPQLEPINFFTAPHSHERMNFLEWFSWAAQQGATAIELRQQDEFAIEPRQVQLDGKQIDQRYLAAFAGTHQNVIALRLPKINLGFRYQIAYPPPTLITLNDALNFIAQHPQERQHFYDAALWQNEHNLHFGKCDSFEGFIALVTPDRVDRFIETFAMAVSNVAVSEQTRADWWTLWTSKRNPAPPKHSIFCFGQAQLPTKKYDTTDRQAAHLGRALKDILRYSRKHSLDEFSLAFERALNFLDSKCSAEVNPALAVLEHLYSEPQYRLFVSLSACGVFGGMGTWNDLGRDDDPEYARVSDQLFRARNQLIESNCNITEQNQADDSILRRFSQLFRSAS